MGRRMKEAMAGMHKTGRPPVVLERAQLNQAIGGASIGLRKLLRRLRHTGGRGHALRHTGGSGRGHLPRPRWPAMRRTTAIPSTSDIARALYDVWSDPILARTTERSRPKTRRPLHLGKAAESLWNSFERMLKDAGLELP
ncbi:MAG: hypothetical protein R2818_14705 [Flavobacteriales bacterium]